MTEYGSPQYEVTFGSRPGVSNLVHFYTPGVYHLTKEERRSLSLVYNS